MICERVGAEVKAMLIVLFDRVIVPGGLNPSNGIVVVSSVIPVIAGDSLEIDFKSVFRLSPLRRNMYLDCMVDLFLFYVPHRFIYSSRYCVLVCFKCGMGWILWFVFKICGSCSFYGFFAS